MSEAPVTPAVSPLHELVEHWRGRCRVWRQVPQVYRLDGHGDMTEAVAHCADELEAALSTPAPRPETEMGIDQPWPLVDVLRKLADAADHLLRDHNCDAHGWEGTVAARDAARRYLSKWNVGNTARPTMVERGAESGERQDANGNTVYEAGAAPCRAEAPPRCTCSDNFANPEPVECPTHKSGAPGSRDGWQPIDVVEEMKGFLRGTNAREERHIITKYWLSKLNRPATPGSGEL